MMAGDDGLRTPEQVAADAIAYCAEWYPNSIFGESLTTEEWQQVRDVSPFSTERIAASLFRHAYGVAAEVVAKAFAEWREEQADHAAAGPAAPAAADEPRRSRIHAAGCPLDADHAGPCPDLPRPTAAPAAGPATEELRRRFANAGADRDKLVQQIAHEAAGPASGEAAGEAETRALGQAFYSAGFDAGRAAAGSATDGPRDDQVQRARRRIAAVLSIYDVTSVGEGRNLDALVTDLADAALAARSGR